MSEDYQIDVELASVMDNVFEIIKEMSTNNDTDDQLRLRVVAHNLRALAEVFMIAKDREEEMEINPTQVALGLIGTSAWILDHLPELEGNLDLGF